MTEHKPKKSLRVMFSGLRIFLFTGLVCLGMYSSNAQDCAIPGFVPPDTIRISSDLGNCQVSTLALLDSLNLDGCTEIQLIPSGPYSIPLSKSIVVYDKVKDEIYAPFILHTTAASLEGLSGVVVNEDEILITIPLGAGECRATKDMVLDQLNVPQEEILRSQIHLISQNARITEFSIGDTTYLESIECSGTDFYQNVKVVFKPTASTFSGVMTFDIGLTTCTVDITEVLTRLGYSTTSCELDRFTFSESGPFGYGLHVLDHIKLDEHFILQDAAINVVASGCPSANIDLGMLPEGKCALNAYDILDTLGLTMTGCDVDNVVLFPGGPYESSPALIERVEIGGRVICNTPFEVSFIRDEVSNETGAIICHQDLNITMGPDCTVRMNADVILANGNYCYLNYNIELSYAHAPQNVIADGHEIIIDQPGNYSLTITNPATGNSCWSEFTIEDKFIEDIRCVPDTVWCYESLLLIPDDTLGGGPDFPDLGPDATYKFSGVTNEYNVASATLCGVAFARYEDDLVDDCTADNFKQIIDRLWTFEDNYGNVDTCTQRIFVKNSTLDIVDPFVTLETDCLSDFGMLDSNGYPSPDTTGYPMINGLYRAGICGTLKMTYNDTEFPLCGLGKKILRRWVIIDWCSDQVMELTQVIRIEDKSAPEITNPLSDLSIDTDPFICGGANIDLPLPSFDDCNLDEVILEIIYQTYDDNGNLIHKSNGSSLFIDEIKTIDVVSTFLIEYILTDPCGNESRDSLRLTISDNEPPVAVCDEFTIISVGGNGNALVRAETFDDLSVDNCGILKYEVRKLEGACDVTGEFTSNIRFCCDEVGDTLLVEFRVTDLAGNENFCEVKVNIQDKFRPIINCPEDITIDCGEDYMNLDLTGRPETRDNCNLIETFFVDDQDLSQCYQGTITRTWMVRDKGGFTESCVQIITIAEDTLFYIEQVSFPNDTVVIGCNASLDPEVTGKPIINTKSCSMVDATHEDLYFYDVENACIKILRQWTVIDWCQRDELNSGIWTEDQIIKLVSDIGPVFDNEEVETTYCIYEADCSGAINISGFAEDGDACTPVDELIWNTRLFDTNYNLIDESASSRISSVLAVGSYYVEFEAKDGCDNASLDTILFEVVDCLAPSISCPAVQPSLVLDPTGLATLNVSDIVDIQIEDNCDHPDSVSLSFDKASIITQINYLCEDLTNGVSDRFIKVYAKDQSGNVDSCELFLQIRDNSSNLCNTNPNDTFSISGFISTQELAPVQNVTVSLLTDQGDRVMTTDETGLYSFDGLSGGEGYIVSFEKNDEHEDGVTTLDILLTQRHILTTKPFESPYQVIAADADNNGRVSATDLVRMRRLVLGLDSEFSTNDQKSWRFVDASQSFDEVRQPFPFEETIDVEDLQESLFDLDFMAVKIGDVNGSNSVSSFQKADIRNASSEVNIRLEGNRVDFIATEDESISGIQLKFLKSRFQSFEILGGGLISLTDKNFFQSDETFAISWTKEEGSELIQKGDILFSIEGSSPEAIQNLISGHTVDKSEWINHHLESKTISFTSYIAEELEKHELITNIMNAPNPFQDFTRISFDLLEAHEVAIELIDIRGNVVMNNSTFMQSGMQSIQIQADNYSLTPGLYIVKISANQQQWLHKLSYVK